MKRARILLFLWAGFLAGCGPSEDHKEMQSRQLHRSSVTIAVQNNLVSTLIFVADARRLFEKQGVNVRIVPWPSGKLAYEAMLAGKADLCTVADMPVSSGGSDVDARILSTVAETQRGCWITANRERGISVPAHLKGKVIGTQKNSAVHYFLSMFLVEHGIDETDVDVRFMRAVQLPGALASGEIDAFSMRNPFANEAKGLLKERAIEFESSVYLQHFLLVARHSWLRSNLDAARQVVGALKEAEEITHGPSGKRIMQHVFDGKRREEVGEDWERYQYHLGLKQSLLLTMESQASWRGLSHDQIPNYLEIIEPGPLSDVYPARMQLRK